MRTTPLLALLLAACSGSSKVADDSAATNSTDTTRLEVDFEVPTYTEGPIDGQDGWADSLGMATIQTSNVHAGSQALALDFSADLTQDELHVYYPFLAPEGTRRYTITVQIMLDAQSSWVGFQVENANGWVSGIAGRDLGGGVAGYSADGYNYAYPSLGWTTVSMSLDLDAETYTATVDGVSLGEQPILADPMPTDLTTVHVYSFQGLGGATGYFDDLSIEMSP